MENGQLVRQHVTKGHNPLEFDGSLAERKPLLLCFSHLRWSFVWQRPQHLMTRLARHFDVYFVEEPMAAREGDGPSIAVEERDGVTVLTPHLPPGSFAPGFGAAVNATIRTLLREALADRIDSATREGAVVWYWTPMAQGAAPEGLDDAVVVHDVMDELAAFHFAPPELEAMEAALLERADLVFTGGPSLFEKRKERHPDIHAFPSAVDVEHFADGREAAVPSDLPVRAGHPVIGYYGVLDERLDLELIDGIACSRPDWQIVLIGPVAKINEEALPRGERIAYLGQRNYADLPAYLAGFDVAILPFALNEATRFISPTKTLEYLAGGRPVVSTPIRDVVTLYGEIVAVAANVSEFVSAIEALLRESPAVRTRRETRARQVLAGATWERTVEAMHDHLLRKLPAASPQRTALLRS